MIRETDAPDPYGWAYAAREYENQFFDDEEPCEQEELDEDEE